MQLKQGDSDIWLFTEDVQDGSDVYKAGFYFVDERTMLDGPYETLKDAREAQFKHRQWISLPSRTK